MTKSVAGQRTADCYEAGSLAVCTDRDGVVHTICLEGELDLANAGDFEAELARVEQTDVESILVDLSGLTFIDSIGVHVLIGARARSVEDSGRLALLCGPPTV